MKLHGLVTASLLLASSGIAQDTVPRPLDAPEPGLPPLLNVPLSSEPAETSDLEREIESLKQELQQFRSLGDTVARDLRAAESDADRTLLRQRQEFLDLLTRLATQGLARAQAPAAPPSPPDRPLPKPQAPPVLPEITDGVVDPFALGKTLFRAGDFPRAELAFRKVPVTDENRWLLKYMIATCQRKQSQWQAALDGYREIAASNQDPVLRDLARFHLDGIQWNLETEKQIEQLKRQRPKSATP